MKTHFAKLLTALRPFLDLFLQQLLLLLLGTQELTALPHLRTALNRFPRRLRFKMQLPLLQVLSLSV